MRKVQKPYFIILICILTITQFQEPAPAKTTWWSVYFTLPDKNGKDPTLNPEAALINLIDNATKSFFGAFYSISSPIIIKKLVEAQKRGVDVRLVTEQDNLRKSVLKKLSDANIPMVPDNSRALMHNKFAIIDERTVWTGSYNLTENSELTDNNNVIVIHSPELAEIFIIEFMKMFEEKQFGNKKEKGIFPALRKKYYVKIEDTNINVYFSPKDNIEKIILKRLGKAKKSVYFMAFSFTSDPLGEEIINLHKNGIKVSGLMEKEGSDTKDSEYIKMKIEGLPVKTDKNRSLMHHKIIIIDEKIVITGSYNFSKGANKRNDENIIIIDNDDIAKEYLKEFHRLYD
jgi:phosphatidylserine/phosphatidylglycerophosphate/cardiolipin synthase-like enzyme